MWGLALGAGVAVRLASVALDGRATQATSLGLGARLQVEASVRLGGGWLAFAGLGVDGYPDRTRFIQGGFTLLVEDYVTPWVALGGRWSGP